MIAVPLRHTLHYRSLGTFAHPLLYHTLARGQSCTLWSEKGGWRWSYAV